MNGNERNLEEICKELLKANLGARPGERFLSVTDEGTRPIGEAMFRAAGALGLEAALLQIPQAARSGEEPPETAAAAMAKADVVVCATRESLTHTRAKKEAAAAGARIATMPGITLDMMENGAITADAQAVEARTKRLAALLTRGSSAEIRKGGYSLRMSLEGRRGIESTGRYLHKGESGNLPSGEAYIAPLEGSCSGELLADGSIVGIGRLREPILLHVRGGLLTGAEGPGAAEWLELLGTGAARNAAEFGIGTNDRARLTGNILEDEKLMGSIHVAFGSNDTFGGTVHAGVHLDAVVLSPDVLVDGAWILRAGKAAGWE